MPGRASAAVTKPAEGEGKKKRQKHRPRPNRRPLCLGPQHHAHWCSELRISWQEKAGGFTHRNNDAG